MNDRTTIQHIIAAFRSGMSTYEIAKELHKAESDVERWLHMGLEGEKKK